MPAARVVDQLRRVVAEDGVVVAIEPDFGSIIEYPAGAGLAAVWCTALARAGADPLIGRKLPSLFSAAGFEIQVQLISELKPPSPHRFEMLRGLPLTDDESQQVAKAAADCDAPSTPLVHLPWFGITARNRR